MPREARTVIQNIPHHITQRGNNRQDVFFTTDDRRAYLEILARQSAAHGMKIHAYCLMTNHIHIVATPERQDSLALALGKTHLIYTQHINRLHKRSGHLWQNRFYSCPVQDDALPPVMRYVENNPVRARLARRAWQYEWSSAAAHTGAQDAAGILCLDAWRKLATPESWKAYLIERTDEEFVRTLRLRTSRGRPLGSDSFISKLETIAGRRLRALPNGRPRKETP